MPDIRYKTIYKRVPASPCAPREAQEERVKISQDKMTISGRGKKAKAKGLIKLGSYGNLFILDADIFVATALKLNELLKKA